jgi:iron complex outermembrane recepter protein
MGNRRSCTFTASLVWIVLICSMPIARAQATTNFDLPAQSLADSLRAVGSQTNTNILFDPPLVAGRRAPALKDNLTTEQALAVLLAGTGIKHEFLNESTIVLAMASTANPPVANASAMPTPSLATAGDASQQEGKKNSSDGFRVAQVDQGTSSNSSSVEKSVGPYVRKDTGQQNLEEIVVTAQKKNEDLLEVPVPVTAISAESLIGSNQLRLQDYYTKIPGLSVATNDFGAMLLTIRGITTGGYSNPTVGITVDDVPYGSSSANGYGEQAPDIDPSDLARVEVLRGPQGTLYGASSIGGLLKYVTVDPSTDTVSGRVEAGTSSVYNGAELGYSVRGSVNVPLSDTLAVRASGFSREDPGYIDDVLTGQRGVNETRAEGGRLSALWKPSEALSLKVSALIQHSTSDGSAYAGVGAGLGDLQQSIIRGFGGFDQTLQAYSATLAAKLGNVDLTAVTGYNVSRNSSSIDYTSILGTFTEKLFGVTGTPLINYQEPKKFTQEIRFLVPIGQRIEWLAGAFYDNENSLRTAQNVPAVVPSTGVEVGQFLQDTLPSTDTDIAVFTDLTFHVTDRFDVQVGGRESQNRQSYMQTFIGPWDAVLLSLPSPVVYPKVNSKDNAFTYLLTPRFKVSPDLMVYARLASGYQPGGPNLTLASSTSTVPLSFKPDTSQNYEIGIKGDVLDHALSFDASLYYIDWKDIQLQLTVANTGIGYLANGSRAKSEGAELSVESRPLRGLIIDAWVTVDDAALTAAFPATSSAYGLKGDRLPYGSRFSGNLSLEQDFPLTSRVSGFVAGEVSYVGNREGVFTGSPQRQYFPDYAKTNLRGGIKYESWTANFFVNNVADKRGILNGGIGLALPTEFYYIQPRTVGVSVAKAF